MKWKKEEKIWRSDWGTFKQWVNQETYSTPGLYGNGNYSTKENCEERKLPLESVIRKEMKEKKRN